MINVGRTASTLRDSHRISTDAILQLKSMDRKTKFGRGCITVKLTSVALMQANAVTSASFEIERTIADSVATASDSETLAVTVGLDLQNSDFLNAIRSVLTKLDVFVRIVDKTSQVRIRN
jgi:hypothetical protein